MKVLHVVDTINAEKGGVSKAVQTMAAESEKKGIYTEVITLDSPEVMVSDGSFKVLGLGPSKGPWSYSRKLMPWLLKNLLRFDFVIIHGLWLYQSYGVTRALEKIKKFQNNNDSIPKLFIMPHGMLDPYFQRAPDRKIKAIRNWIYWKLIEKKVVNNADAILFTCKEECRLANEAFSSYQPKQKIVIGLGVTEPPAADHIMRQSFIDKCPEIKNRSYLLFLGRLDPKKGVDNLINAYQSIASEINSENKCVPTVKINGSPLTNKVLPGLVIAGPGLHTSYGRKLQKMVSGNPLLQASVFFCGMLEGAAKWGAFYGAEAFILPSHQENFGIAVVEALACSKPVLVSRAVNISYEIQENTGGFIEPDSLNGTCNLIRSWHKLTFDKKMEMTQKARRCFEICFAVSPAIDRLIETFSNKEPNMSFFHKHNV